MIESLQAIALDLHHGLWISHDAIEPLLAASVPRLLHHRRIVLGHIEYDRESVAATDGNRQGAERQVTYDDEIGLHVAHDCRKERPPPRAQECGEAERVVRTTSDH